MRYITSLVICLFLLETSCEKASIPVPGSLAGIWIWAYTYNDGAPGPTNPLTPLIAGYGEQLEIKTDYTWRSFDFSATSEPIPVTGTFSVGHGSYTPYKGAYTYSYDSIIFYKNGVYSDTTIEYYRESNDTLMFCGCLAGLTGSRSKTYIKHSD
jgi:hypothetical protein